MRLLLDQNDPKGIGRALVQHQVQTASRMGWERLRNGELLARAELAGFDLLITCDRNMAFQQNLAGRRLALLVLGTKDWQRLRRSLDAVSHAVDEAAAASVTELAIPD